MPRERSLDHRRSTSIRAEFDGSAQCTAEGISANSGTPVLAICQTLVEAGFGPDQALHVYRGNVLCLVVRSIGEAAELEISSKGTGFVKRRAPVRTASPMRLQAQAAVRCLPALDDAAVGGEP